MQASKFDISILDLNLPGVGGIELFEKFRAANPEHQVIVLTGFGNLESARASIRLDVVDFLEKPCPLGELEKSLHRATQRLVRPMPQPLVPRRTGAAGTTSRSKRLRTWNASTSFPRFAATTATARRPRWNWASAGARLQYKLSEYQRQGFAVDE